MENFAFWAVLPVNKSEFFAVDRDMQKLSFWKLSTEWSFSGKEFVI